MFVSYGGELDDDNVDEHVLCWHSVPSLLLSCFACLQSTSIMSMLHHIIMHIS